MTDPGAWSEADLLRAVLELAATFGWLAHHQRPGLNQRGRWASQIQGDAGGVDVTLVRAPRVLFWELKSAKGRLSPAQGQWRAALEACPGVEYAVWRPADMEAIVEELR